MAFSQQRVINLRQKGGSQIFRFPYLLWFINCMQRQMIRISAMRIIGKTLQTLIHVAKMLQWDWFMIF